MMGRFDSKDLINISKECVQLIKKAFEECAKADHYFVKKQEFCEELRGQPNFRELFQDQEMRDKPYGDLGKENVQDVIKRIIQEADDYIDIDEAIDFFTRKGRPVCLDYQFDEERLEKKERHLRQTLEREVSSSPEESQSQIREKKRLRKLKKALGEDELQPGGYRKKAYQQKITVPDPFAFENRPKPKSTQMERLYEWLEKKKKEEDEIVESAGRFKANKLPKHIRDKKR